MTLAGRIVEQLRIQGVPCAVIGGVAMAVHGIARATIDLDIFVVSPTVLDESRWRDLGADVVVHVSKGDASDPLAGVVRLLSGGAIVDIVVGSSRWMHDAVSRAIEREVGGERLPVVDAADLVLLKLYAGGPQDLVDVRLLLAADPGLRSVVQGRIGATPPSIAARLLDVRPI
jgi:Nucleotidyl transferase of unknown function (DUF2204)